MKEKRIEYLDSIKAASILLVVFCHYVLLSKETIIGNVVMTLAWGAVPCFMMVSGSVMLRTKNFEWKKYLIKLVKIYVALVAWRGIYLLVYSSWNAFKFSKVQLIQYFFFFTDLTGIDTGVMWYMIAYLVVLLFFPVTHYLFCFGGIQGHRILVFLMGLFLLSGIVMPSLNWIFVQVADIFHVHVLSFSGINRILPFTNYANMLFYFTLGAFLFEYRDQIVQKMPYRGLSWFVIVMGAAGLLLVKFWETKSYAWNGIYISNGYSHIMTTILSVGIYLTFMCYDAGKINSLLLGTGCCTMGIYYMHYIMLAACNVFIYPKLKEYYSFGLNCLKTLIITFLCVLITKLINKVPYIKALVM